MRFSPLVLFTALALAASTPGCDPNQGEGETCTSNDDCASGLTCLKGTVCCPPDPKTSSSIDCQNNGGGTVTDSGGDGIVIDTTPAPDTGTGATDAVGHSCKHTSDCPAPLICLPGGTCGYECAGDRDCLAGDHCDCAVGTCAPGPTGGAESCADSGAADSSTPDTTPTDTATDTADDTGAADTGVDETADAPAE